MEKINPKNDWEIKYLREQWTMPFGSMLNAYAQNISGKDKSVSKMLKDIDELFHKSQELIFRSFIIFQSLNEIEKGDTIQKLKDWIKKVDSGEIKKEQEQIRESEVRIERAKIDEVVDEVNQSEELNK